VGDFHECVLGVGPISPPGSQKVVIGEEGAFAARLGDRAECPGTDMIVMGAAKVLVGGLPAARIEDRTGNAGTIVQGLENVLIGGPTVTAAQMANNQGKTNTVISYDKANNRIFIVSYLEFSGPCASEDYAQKAKAQIEKVWGGTHTVRHKPTEVTVQVNVKYNWTGRPTPGYDQITVNCTVNHKDHRPNQRLGGGPGQQLFNSVGPNSLVAAHEFGHTLGVDDQYKDTPGGSVPDPAKTSNLKNNIMAQTWPTNGVQPRPYDEHYHEMLSKRGL
jgi:uncharacterized Zn-binding protein involved in type VI secretion